MSTSTHPTATEAFKADGFAVRCEVLRLSAQPSGGVLLVQFLLDCGVAALFGWQYSVRNAVIWITLIAVTTAYRAFFPQRLPDPLTRDNLLARCACTRCASRSTRARTARRASSSSIRPTRPRSS